MSHRRPIPVRHAYNVVLNVVIGARFQRITRFVIRLIDHVSSKDITSCNQEKQKGKEGRKKFTRGRRRTRPSTPQKSDIKEALLQSFRAGPPTVKTFQRSLNSLGQSLGNVSEADEQYATEATTRSDLSQRHADTYRLSNRRVTFNTPSGHYLLSSPEEAEDVDAELAAARAERAPSVEIISEAEYQASDSSIDIVQ